MNIFSSNLSDTLSASLNSQENTEFFQYNKNSINKKVKCVLDVATNTGTFIGDFITDNIPDVSASLSLDNDNSPTFFRSSSSSHEVVYETIFENTKIDPNTFILSNSIIMTNKLDSNFSNYNYITPPISKHIYPDPKNNITKPSTTTTSDTFEFLFAPVEDQNLDKNIIKLSSQIKNTKRVNFDVLKSEVLSDYNFQSSSVFKSLVNRNLSSFVYYDKEKSLGDQGNDETSLTKSMKQISDVSELPCSKQDSCLPSNPEGDTYDSHSDMIKIYPRILETKHTRQQLFNYLHHEESPPSQFSTVSDTSKMNATKQIEKVRPQKIYSKYHRPLLKPPVFVDSDILVRNQSIEMVRFFHQTLTHIEE